MREALLKTALIVGTLIVVFTEFLSFFRILSPLGVRLLWGLSLLAAVAWKARRDKKIRFPFPSASPATVLLLSGVGILSAVIGLVAFMGAPNTADSMVYHMSRVAHWIQNKSVEHYPTVILRQLHQCPFAEFAILHLQLIFGNDRFANFVQFFSYLGSLVAVSLITKKLGGDTRAQVISVVFCATLPMAILQGSSTQNDLVAGFWMLCAVYYLLAEKNSPFRVAGFVMSVGLAALTKQTSYVFLLPFGLWWLVLCLKEFPQNKKKALSALALTVLVPVLLNAGHWTRNQRLFGSPLGLHESGDSFHNEIMSPAFFASNVVRNLAIHAGSPFASVNLALENAIRRFHDRIGVDVRDSRNNMDYADDYRLEGVNTNEDLAGNPLHFALLAVFVLLFFFHLRGQEPKRVIYFFCVLAGFLFFCFYVKWVHYHSRLHLPLFMLLAPWVALPLAQLKSKILPLAILSLMLVSSFYWAGWNKFKPLFGKDSIFRHSRADQYFNNRPFLRGSYKRAVEFVRQAGYKRIGLLAKDPNFEYPLWALLQKDNPGILIEHIGVDNISSSLGSENFEPDALIFTGSKEPLSRLQALEYARRYGGFKFFGHVLVFGKES